MNQFLVISGNSRLINMLVIMMKNKCLSSCRHLTSSTVNGNFGFNNSATTKSTNVKEDTRLVLILYSFCIHILYFLII